MTDEAKEVFLAGRVRALTKQAIDWLRKLGSRPIRRLAAKFREV
jgi:hypothetical protein